MVALFLPHDPSVDQESAPLLPPSALQASLAHPTPKKKKNPKGKEKKPWRLLVALTILLIAIFNLGGFLAEPPKIRVYEANLCVHYYEKNDVSKIRSDGTVDEALCKENEIQQKVAMIFGWQDMFDAIPGILLAVLFGTLADKWGRKWILTTALMGLQLGMAWVLFVCYFRTLPLQLVWLSSAFYLIGGGPNVALAIGVTMVSDIVPPEKRASVFVYLTASVLVAELIAPILVAYLMQYGNAHPILFALAIQQVGIFIALLLPETLHLRDLPEPSDYNESEPIKLQPKEHGFGLKAQIEYFKDAFAFIRSDMTLAMVVLTFLGDRLGRHASSLLIRYASKRYGWRIQDASFLLLFRAATNLVALIVFIPGVNILLLNYLRLPAHHADFWMACGSTIITTIAMLAMGVAGHPALLILGLLIYNLGTGFNAAMRSIAIHIVGGQSSPNIGRLMAVIAIMESIGMMIAGPLLNNSFQWAMVLGEPWLGLPFLASALVFGSMTFLMFLISIRNKEFTCVEVDPIESMNSASPHSNNSTLEYRFPQDTSHQRASSS